MKNTIQAIGCAALVLLCTENGDNALSRLENGNAGGKTTVFVQTSQAFGLPTPQKIYAYTDMLLHDMGDDLADNRPEFQANGNE